MNKNVDQKCENHVLLEEREIEGFKTRTFIKQEETVELTIASDGKSTIVAIPKNTTSLRNQMSDEEFKCLAKCKDKPLEERLNCILLCPVSKNYQVFIY